MLINGIEFIEQDGFLFLKEPKVMRFMEIDSLIPGCNAIAEKVIVDGRHEFKAIAFAKCEDDNKTLKHYFAEHYKGNQYTIIIAACNVDDADFIREGLSDFYE